MLSWDSEIDAVIIGCNEMVVTRPGCNETKLGKPRVSTKATLIRGTVNVTPWLFTALGACKLPAGMKLERK